ncbi:NYN domain-containing protein [Nocardioides sp. TRM66260-LWL]|uniref:NYN domain-containing protein n=1 Tax=Nocardioides sp. TRM66260-LWL TaxID=2874478 RepID=UPI001CC456F7|nr:NYN domain-containing protein [Nocardioides sp. TRM66260-LWL]MBZ5734318.1 NYN domain-containing protein [Nocardioides sp. TRM66260-LWL]
MSVEPPAAVDLPDEVRARIVALVVEVLPEAGSLPPALRRIAAFAPARRARLGSSAVLDALADDALRERLAVLVAVREGADAAGRPAADPGAPGDPDGPDDLDDPAGLAAHAWLHRGEGWAQTLAAALERLRPADGSGAPDDDGRVARLVRRLADAEQRLREARAAHRHDLDEAKAEIAALRRRVGELRRAAPDASLAARLSAAEAERDAARAEVADLAAALARAEEAARDAASRAERATRSERGGAPADDAGGARQRARREREEASLRARVLLETVLEAAAGLRRELALPTALGTPGERVETRLAADGAPELSDAGPALTVTMLEARLAMPRSRLVVDGYNVSKAGWPGAPLDVQRARLLAALAPLAARTGAETTVVFDAAEASERPPVRPPRGVRVLFSPPGVIADDVIGELVEAEPDGRVVLVVTDDAAVRARTARAGARGVPSRVLLDLLAR